MDDILQNVVMGNLLAIYGRLLTEKQYRLLDLHFNQDYSLAEIAEQENISRQAVHDALKRGEKSLKVWEEQLQVLHRQQNIQNIISMAIKTIQRWELSDEEQRERLNILQELQTIIEESEEEANGI